MKNLRIVIALALACLCTSGTQAQSIKDILKGAAETIVGNKATTATSIKGTWKYSGPACEFESDNLLSKAGGTAAATKIENKIAPTLKKLGVTGIVYTFDGEGNYTSKIKTRVTKGTYKFDSSKKTITFTPAVGKSYTAYVATQGSTMSLTFSANKLMSMLQTITNATSKLSTTASVLGSVMSSYKGMRLGFELKK